MTTTSNQRWTALQAAWLIAAMSVACMQAPVFADSPAPAPAATKPSPAVSTYRVAVFDFDSKDPGNLDAGKQIAEAVAAMLTGENDITLVERNDIQKALKEQEISLTGVVDSAQATKVGKIVGANILITGKAFQLGKQMFVTAKLIGAETTVVEGVLVKGGPETPLDELVAKLVPQIVDRLHQSGAKLLPSPPPADPMPELKLKLAKLAKPKVVIMVRETHVTDVRPPGDPAVETEMKILFKDAGFTVIDIPQNDLTDWARRPDPNLSSAWPMSVSDADVIITGKAFSEAGPMLGNLSTCAARTEINVINRADGRILNVQRTTSRAVDLGEHIAAKKALEHSGHDLGICILQYFSETLPESH